VTATGAAVTLFDSSASSMTCPVASLTRSRYWGPATSTGTVTVPARTVAVLVEKDRPSSWWDWWNS